VVPRPSVLLGGTVVTGADEREGALVVVVVTAGTPAPVVVGTGTLIDVTVGIGSTPGPPVASTTATGAGSIADRMPSQDSPTAAVVTTAHAARYPIDRLTATSLR
jgi:hypothetical protein